MNAPRPDHLTSVVQLTTDALSDREAPGVLEDALIRTVMSMAHAARATLPPRSAAWETFRLRVERSDPTPQGLDTSLRIRATVDVTP